MPSHLIEDGPGSDGEEDMSEEEGEDAELDIDAAAGGINKQIVWLHNPYLKI